MLFCVCYGGNLTVGMVMLEGLYRTEWASTEDGWNPVDQKTHRHRHTSSLSICFTAHTHIYCSCEKQRKFPCFIFKGAAFIQWLSVKKTTHLQFRTDSGVSLPNLTAEGWRKWTICGLPTICPGTTEQMFTGDWTMVHSKGRAVSELVFRCSAPFTPFKWSSSLYIVGHMNVM